LIPAFKTLLLFLVLGLWAQPALAGTLRYCDEGRELDVAIQDRLIRVAGVVKDELEKSGQTLALVSRSGLALQRFDQRYSHAGVSIKGSANTPWSVRQLYYACDEKRPRVFDQGMAGFVLGSNDPDEGYVSLVFLPEGAGYALEQTALNDRTALQLLANTYSANAYPFSERYQNCNQWLAELLATAWGELSAEGSLRGNAQQWLKDQRYTPSVMHVGWRPLMWIADQVQWIHSDDHPEQDLAAALYRVSMPSAIEAFVRDRLPDAHRVELCYTKTHVVIHRGWEPIAAGCQAAPEDESIPLTLTAQR
jgi:hypothetical protein